MSKRFKKIYIEITNICNLNCRFCPKTKRSGRFMSADEFLLVCRKIEPYTDYIYLHLMGEPLLHPQLDRIIEIANAEALKVCITTNGTLLPKQRELLLKADGIHKISISLQAMEGNEEGFVSDEYIQCCADFGKDFSEKAIVAFRLWNEGGADTKNKEIIKTLSSVFPKPWADNPSGFKLKDKVFLEIASTFDWPQLPEEEDRTIEKRDRYFCYGLRDQAGILADGTVVPCCLDHEGDIPLGNIFEEDPAKIFEGPRAKAIYDGFTKGCAAEKLCRNCGYASRFK